MTSEVATQRGFEIVREYMMADARRGEFSIVLVATFDQIARSTKTLFEIADELNELGNEFISAREQSGRTADGSHVHTRIGSIAELERR